MIRIAAILTLALLCVSSCGPGQPAATQPANPAGSKAVETKSVDSARQYRNPRFDFSLQYPGPWKVQESDNGDGAAIISPDGLLRIRAFGQNDVGLYENLEELMRFTRKEKQARCGEPLAESGSKVVEVSGINVKVIVWRCLSATEPTTFAAFAERSGAYRVLYVDEAEPKGPEQDARASAIFDQALSSWRIGDKVY